MGEWLFIVSVLACLFCFILGLMAGMYCRKPDPLASKILDSNTNLTDKLMTFTSEGREYNALQGQIAVLQEQIAEHKTWRQVAAAPKIVRVREGDPIDVENPPPAHWADGAPTGGV